MKIISKRQVMAIYRQHPQSRLIPFCTGRYKWSGSICHYAGREVQDISGVLAVFAESRQNRYGPYVVLRSVTLYAKGLTCEADSLGSHGYIYIVIYPTPAAST